MDCGSCRVNIQYVHCAGHTRQGSECTWFQDIEKSTVKVMNHATVTFLPDAAFYIQSLSNSRVNNRVHGTQGGEHNLIFIAGYRRSWGVKNICHWCEQAQYLGVGMERGTLERGLVIFMSLDLEVYQTGCLYHRIYTNIQWKCLVVAAHLQHHQSDSHYLQCSKCSDG